MKKTIIKVEQVSKEYRLGAIGGTTLRDDLQRLGAKLRGREDPTMKIGGDSTHKYNEKFLALDDVSFEVKQGEALGIIGHNGAGKSTLLKLLSRVTAPTKGTISYNGRVASMLEVGTGFHPELTGRENVYMNGAILGMTKAEIDSKFNQIVEFAEMERFIDTPVKRYSSGMYVKLAFAVAAHLDSEILIMDEVLAVGDMKFQQKCLGKMGDASNNEGRTVLYVSHNMSTIRQLCTRCIVLDHGKIVYDGKVDEAINVYMSRETLGNVRDINLTEMRMPHLPKELIVKMTHFHLSNVEQAWYKAGDKIRFELTVKAYQSVHDLRFRLELRYIDDTPVGVALCPSLGDIKAGENRVFHMAFSSDLLTGGKYKCLFVLYAVNEFGTYVDYDAIYPVFSFEIEEISDLLWRGNMWGRIKFNDIDVS